MKISPKIVIYQNGDESLLFNPYLKGHNKVIAIEPSEAEAFINGSDDRAIRDKWMALAPGMFGTNINPAHQELINIKRRIQQSKEAAAIYRKAPNNEEYHKDGIVDAQKQFNRHEITLSHLYREPTTPLNGLNYSEALITALRAWG